MLMDGMVGLFGSWKFVKLLKFCDKNREIWSMMFKLDDCVLHGEAIKLISMDEDISH